MPTPSPLPREGDFYYYSFTGGNATLTPGCVLAALIPCALRARAHLQGLRMLWISQPCGLGRICPHAVGAVDYGPDDPVDYASGARCGLCGFALWSSGLEARARGVPVGW